MRKKERRIIIAAMLFFILLFQFVSVYAFEDPPDPIPSPDAEPPPEPIHELPSDSAPEPTPSPDLSPEPSPEPFPEPTPLPEASPEPSPDPNDERTWLAEPITYDLNSGYSEERERMIAAVEDELRRIEAERAPISRSSDRTTAQTNLEKDYRSWFCDRFPQNAECLSNDGWSGLFLLWAADRAGMIASHRFPVAIKAEAIESLLISDGNPLYSIEEYRSGSVSCRDLQAGDIIFLPGKTEQGKKAGIVISSDSNTVEIVFGDMGNTVQPFTYALSGIRNGSILKGAEVVTFLYQPVSDRCFDFCVHQLGMNEAAACGFLANILAESGFRQILQGDCGLSIGLCQWQGPRRDYLSEFCFQRGLDPELVDSQLAFVEWELQTYHKNVLDYLLSVENTEEGAYLAADEVCRKYEAPEHSIWRGKQRGLTAQQTLWPIYGA